MPRLRRRGHVLVEKNTPAGWRDYYLAEIRARRFPLLLPEGKVSSSSPDSEQPRPSTIGNE